MQITNLRTHAKLGKKKISNSDEEQGFYLEERARIMPDWSTVNADDDPIPEEEEGAEEDITG